MNGLHFLDKCYLVDLHKLSIDYLKSSVACLETYIEFKARLSKQN